jgi:hypothetical protein
VSRERVWVGRRPWTDLGMAKGGGIEPAPGMALGCVCAAMAEVLDCGRVLDQVSEVVQK